MDDYTIPDAIGDPVVAWRVWFVVPKNKDSGELRLRSFVYQELWEPGEAHVAICNNPSQPGALERPLPHDAPDDEHKCGIYAVKDREQVDHYFREPMYKSGQWKEIYRVIGRVNLWGKIIPGDKGYRAQFAYPHSIEVPSQIRGREQFLSTREIASSLRHYGVDVVVTGEVIDLKGRSPLRRYNT
jgi:hypothetical protein